MAIIAFTVLVFFLVGTIFCCYYCGAGGDKPKTLSVEPSEISPLMGTAGGSGGTSGAVASYGEEGGAVGGPTAAINKILAHGISLHTKKGPKKVTHCNDSMISSVQSNIKHFLSFFP